MKVKILFIVIFVFLVGIFLWRNVLAESDKDASKIIPLPLKSVEIFLKNTLMKHEIDVKLNVGDTILHFGEVAENIDTNQISIENSENIKIIKKECRNFLSVNPAQEKEYKLYQDSILIIKDSLVQYKIEAEAINKTQEVIFSNKPLSNNQEALSADKLKEVSKFLRQYYADTQKESKNWQKKIKLAEEKIIIFEKKIMKINQTPTQKMPQLLLYVRVNKKIALPLSIKYITNAAFWQPIQKFSLAEKDSLITLKQNCIITQNTGFDWKKIKVSLANRYQEKEEYLQNFPPVAENMELYFDTLNNKKDTTIKDNTKQIKKIKENIVQKVFKDDFDIPTGEAFTLLWNEKKFPFEKKMMGWLSANLQIYQVAILKNWTDDDFPKGKNEMNYLDQKPKNISWNQENDIILPLENVAQVNTKMDKKIITNSSTNKIWQIDFEVQSIRNDTLEVVFEELIPTSSHKDLSIELKNTTNNGERKQNKIRWKMTLLPQQKKEWSLQYEAKFPEKATLQSSLQ